MKAKQIEECIIFSENHLSDYINSLPSPLTEQEKLEINKRIIEGDDTAREILFERNLRLVVKIATKFRISRNATHLDLMDFIQDGNIGLYRAAEAFNPTKGYKFSSYASASIKREIERGFRKSNNLEKYPENIYEDLKKYDYAYNKLQSRFYGKGITDYSVREKSDVELIVEEIARELDWTVEYTKKISSYKFYVVSMNQLIDDFDCCMEDFIPSLDNSIEKIIVEQSMSDLLKKIINDCNLPDRELEIFYLRKGIDGRDEKSLACMSKMYGGTKENIRRIENKVLRKLREHPKMRWAVDYLDDSQEALKKLDFFNEEYRTKGNVTQKAIEEYNQSGQLKNHIPVDRRGLNRGRQFKSLLEICGISKKEYDIIYEKLTDANRKRIYKGYGEDIENPIRSSDWSMLDSSYLTNCLVPKIKKLAAEYRMMQEEQNSQMIESMILSYQENSCEIEKTKAPSKQKSLGTISI